MIKTWFRRTLLMVLFLPFVRAGSLAADAAEIPFAHIILDSGAYGHRAVGDVDGDGRNDVVAVDLAADGAALAWYRYPDWTKRTLRDTRDFGDFRLYRSDDLSLADIDRDGDLDAVGRIGLDNDIDGITLWFENPRPSSDPASTPWPRHDIGANRYVKDISVADFDRDGKIDIATREHTEVQIWYQGTPTSWTRVSIAIHDHEGMDIGDLDLDGDADIVLNGFWLENPGNRTGAWVEHAIDSRWYTQSGNGWQDNNSNVAVADVNRDGLLDVLLSHSEMPGYPVSWYEAADPKRGPWTEHRLADVFDYAQTLQSADFDNDGDVDVLVAEFPRYDAPYPVVVFVNEGDGMAWTRQTLGDTGMYHGVVGDIGSDGDLDIVGTRNFDRAPIEMWENKIADSKLALDRWTYIQVDDGRAKWGDFAAPDWMKYFGLAMGDLTGDGLADIASGRYFYRNPGGAMDGAWPRVDYGSNVDAILIVDVDGDSRGDVIAQALPDLYWLEALDAQGTAWNRVKIASVPAVDSHILSQGYKLAQIYPGGKPEIALAAGDGIYVLEIPANPSAGNWPALRVAPGASSTDVAVGDIDRDGRPDLFGVDPSGGAKIAWWRNPGDRTANWAKFKLGDTDGNWPDRVAVADLNLDGRLDVIVTEEEQVLEPQWKTYWFEAPSNPTASGWTRRTVATQYTTNSLDVGDIDRDGDPDLITGEHRGTKVLAIWENDGRGNFIRRVVDSGKESHLGARLVDLDRDGDQEIVSIAWDDYRFLHLWRNDAVLATPQPDPNWGSIVVGEDANGRLEVVLENSAIKVRYGHFFSDKDEWAIQDFIIKAANEDQAGSYIDACADRRDLSQAVIVYDGADRKTVRLEWENGAKVEEVSIFPDSPVLKIDYLKYGVNIVDIGSPGGIADSNASNVEYAFYGQEDWIRPALIYPESYYNRYPGDGINDPSDGGSLNYHGYFIMGVYNKDNGRGFARVMPVEHDDILKLLWKRGFENFPNFQKTHKPYTAYLFAVTGGPEEVLRLGKALADGAIPGAVAAPVITPSDGTYVGSVTVSLTTSTAGATIRYTLDGQEPTAASTAYTGPITLRQTTTVKARAFKSGFQDSAVTSALFTVTPASGARVTQGLLVLYEFAEGAGLGVHDTSGVGTPLDLAIADGTKVAWGEGNLAINDPTSIASSTPAEKVIAGVKGTNALTVEAWVAPASAGQNGPARIVTVSADPYMRNVTLGQGVSGGPSDVYDVRLRTSVTGQNGMPSLSSPAGTLVTQLSHVVFTREASGAARIYVDGVERASGTFGGDLANWDDGFRLGLANELTGDRPWLGTYHLVALYDRALAQAEVMQNFNAGPDPVLGPTFADVPVDHPYFSDIEALYRAGYTAGCNTNPLRYCPEATMNRGESAVFVERGIHTASYDPPAPAMQVFADLALDSWAAKWVNGLWEDRYTAGCGTNPLVYCPWQGHTRAEASVFYLRMLNGADFAPPPPISQRFMDVPLGGWYAKWVEAAYEAGLIEPCATTPEPRFCPDDPLTRAIAAHMMVKAKNLTIP